MTSTRRESRSPATSPGAPTRIRARLAEPDSPKVQSARRLSGAAACPGRSAGRPVVDHAPPHRRSNRSTRPAMTKRCLGGVLPHQAAVAIETDVRPTWASPSGWPRNRGSPRRAPLGAQARLGVAFERPDRCGRIRGGDRRRRSPSDATRLQRAPAPIGQCDRESPCSGSSRRAR